MTEVKNTQMEELKEQIRSCTKCEIRNRTKVPCFDDGNMSSPVIFVGEAEGIEEQEVGRPFVGVCGKFLDRIFTGVGISRADVWFGNIVCCRPTDSDKPRKDRKPTAEEITNCEGYLAAQIEYMSPRYIVALGETAAHYLTGERFKIGQMRGKLYPYIHNDAISVYCCYHPSYILRNCNVSITGIFWQDMMILRDIISNSTTWRDNQ